MRMLTAALAATLSLSANFARAEDPGPVDCAGDAGSCTGPRLGVFAEGVLLKARGADVLYAQPRDGVGFVFAPRGSQGIVEPNYTPGIRVGADYLASPCAKFEASVLWWESRDSSSIFTPNGTVLNSSVVLPSFQNASAQFMFGSATEGIQLKSVDADYNHLMCGNSCFYVSWLAGFQYANFRQYFNSAFTVNNGTTTVDTHIDFNGGGPRVGLEGQVLLGCGFRIFARGTVDLLAGHFGCDFNQQNTFVGNQGFTEYRNDRVVPVLDLRVGLGWTSSNDRFSLMAGYDLSAWFNMVTTADLINAAQSNITNNLNTNNFTTNNANLKNTITLDGLTARVEFRF
jgi:hypothetical protein